MRRKGPIRHGSEFQTPSRHHPTFRRNGNASKCLHEEVSFVRFFFCFRFFYADFFFYLYILWFASQGYVTSAPNSTPRRSSHDPSLIFSFHLLPSRLTLPDFPSRSSQASLPFLSCCYRTTTTTSSYSFFIWFVYDFFFMESWHLHTCGIGI